MEAHIELIREDGSIERHRLTEEQVTIGRSPTAGIPIPDSRELEPEHVLIAPRGDGCWVAVAQGAQVSARVRGEPFEHGIVPWGTEVELGALKIRVLDKLEAAPDQKKGSPIVLFGGAAILILGAMMMFEATGGSGIDTRAPDPVDPFVANISCEGDADTVRFRARTEAEAAFALSETYPFRPADGVRSVVKYRTAEACFRRLGDAPIADRMQAEAEAMKERVELAYSTHRLRLDRAMAQSQWSDALHETQSILAIVGTGDHPYQQWLGRNYQRLLSLVVP